MPGSGPWLAFPHTPLGSLTPQPPQSSPSSPAPPPPAEPHLACVCLSPWTHTCTYTHRHVHMGSGTPAVSTFSGTHSHSHSCTLTHAHTHTHSLLPGCWSVNSVYRGFSGSLGKLCPARGLCTRPRWGWGCIVAQRVSLTPAADTPCECQFQAWPVHIPSGFGLEKQ